MSRCVCVFRDRLSIVPVLPEAIATCLGTQLRVENCYNKQFGGVNRFSAHSSLHSITLNVTLHIRELVSHY